MRTRQTTRAAAAAVGALLLVGAVQLAAESAAQDWPQFRGVNRDGVSREKGLAKKWPADGPTEVWRRPLGDGYSAITIVGNRLFTMYAAENEEGKGTEYAAAFDAKTGEQHWRIPLGERYENEFGNGPRSTPSVDGETVYMLDSGGTFVALAVEDGAERWRLSLSEAFGAEQPYFGFSTSPLVDGDQLVIEGGGKEGKAFVGLDKKTGDVKWGLGDTPAGYNSPIAVEMGGERRYVYLVEGKLMCIDENGKEIFSHPWPRGETHGSPIFIPPNRIFASGAEGVGAAVIEVEEQGGEAKVGELWKQRFMRNHFSSSVLHGDYIYGFDNATLKCISAKDGELAWAKRGLGKGSLIYADGHLYVLSDRGKLVLVEATPNEYREKGSVQALEGRCWTAPTLAGGKLYLRNHEEMVVYDLKG